MLRTLTRLLYISSWLGVHSVHVYTRSASGCVAAAASDSPGLCLGSSVAPQLRLRPPVRWGDWETQLSREETVRERGNKRLELTYVKLQDPPILRFSVQCYVILKFRVTFDHNSNHAHWAVNKGQGTSMQRVLVIFLNFHFEHIFKRDALFRGSDCMTLILMLWLLIECFLSALLVLS